MLTIDNISHTYHRRKGAATRALDGVSFDAAHGEVTAVIGPNGSGKSTLFRLVTGALHLQQGGIQLDGQHPGSARLGVVFQSPALDRQLTVFENLYHHALLYGRRLKKAQLPAELLDVLELNGRLDSKVDELSGGFQRRVELAKALLTEPELLVLDEPFTGLDINARDAFFSVLQHVTAARGLTTLLVTHELSVATRCDRVVLFEEGTVIANERPGALLSDFGRMVVVIRGEDLDTLAARIAASSDIVSLRIADDALLLKNTTLQDVLMIVDERDSRIHDIEARRPTLEDYFIARTGHALQDAVGELEAA
ncbi:MAG: ABC transporter ATP-binding protein [Bacteroidetes bacterium]|nr:ABC transporter ATP-binding protein [Bacteroidota bacterium]